MSAVCPNGHDTVSTDYCDICGSPVAPGGGAPASAPPAAPSAPALSGNSLDLPPVGGEGGPKDCPNCDTPNTASSLFCEACGYDFTTGALPAAMPAGAPMPAEAEPMTPPSVVAAEVESSEEGVPDGTGEVAGLGAEELDADGLSVAAPGEAGEGEPGEFGPGEIGHGEGEPGESGIPTPDERAALEGEEAETPEAGVAPEIPEPPISGEAESPEAPEASTPGPVAGGVDPSVPPRIPFQWVAEVWIDPDWYADQQAEEPLPSAGLPVVVPLRIASALIGRASASRNIVPDIDCSADPGVSRRHAQLTTDGSRWFVEDLQSSNGTFVGAASGPLPDDPIAVGPKTEVGDNRIYVGAWTRIVVRRATDEEIAIG